ncbi:MAG: hypothetical protein A2131_01710 [Candidatus Sungbacteria bacterium GWC2_49_10]|uniref:Adenylate kinase n=2 Tax=Parcubacteria group TaxID=1794811 RepID=A0A0G1WQS2_9BACT|nr:MAG: Adenylate kinase [Parcubacteria group bacterium GW2011_GWB1_50_9]KKW21116.1 MAG: Adenylate kinase [Candidatus Adlerbacteria bacterium GW2011_GWC1_50_9]KKW33814.1 MAG: Adenylate kinase [Parcubacteria group bacterium GW2011_GWA1_53_13]OGZ93378.1 MAG: hypothetical protein A2131_01710 [Candidatus Sungbacteria bacterium GWC2_49_10]
MVSLSKKFTICIIGRSGSGKGVQAHMILRARAKQIHHMETGRFLRDIVYRHTNPTTAIARRLMGQGKLFPAWFSGYTWLREIIEGGRADKEFLFDGAPRQIFEARLLDEVLLWHGRPKSLCIYLDVKEKTAEQRLFSRGRTDDTASAIKSRMGYFRKDVLPVIAYYRRAGRLISVNGEEAPESVFQNISNHLRRRLGKQWGARQ